MPQKAQFAPQKAFEYLRYETNDFSPEIAIVLGSGLGGFTKGLEGLTFGYKEIPGFPRSTVEGHAGELLFTTLFGKKLAIMSGRFHYYEGHSLQETTLPVRVFKKLGVEKILLTNASGGINKGFRAGDLVLIKDHINLMGTNPLLGKNDEEFGPRFPDMSCVYDADLRKVAQNAARNIGINLRQGVYAAVTGPSYETPAEVKMLETLGADLVGMSTVPEAIIARHCGLKVLGLSLCTNAAAGVVQNCTLNHEEVVATGKAAGDKFGELIKEILKMV